MSKNWINIKKSSYLIIASSVIVVAILSLLFMQFQSIRQTKTQAQATLKANLELHLFEVSETAKRGIMDHANHILHGIRQKRVRERQVSILENIYHGLYIRYPEIEGLYVVFFEPGKELETWRALTYIPLDESEETPNLYKGKPVGRLVDNKENSKSILRAWQTIEKQNMTKLYSAFDPQTDGKENFKQYFIHTVFEGGTSKLDSERRRVGLLVISANPQNFPSNDYFENVIAKYQNRNNGTNRFDENFTYTVSFNSKKNKNENLKTSITKGFDSSDKIFPNLTFTVAANPKKNNNLLNEYFQSSIILGFIAAMIALIGLFMTWRATQSEMRIAQLKSDFLANISHELKTPLTSIRAFGDLIHSGRSKNIERTKEYGGIIKTESDRLTQIINDILEMSRLEKGVRRFDLKENDLSEIALETIEVFSHSPKVKKFKINVQMPETPIKTKCDEGAIRQAILNLLSNAVKYSKPKSPFQIKFSLEVINDSAILKVKDYGVGISKSEQKKIFVPFQRSEQDKIQAKRGTGLGLAITKEIINGHGGKISVESKIDEGSTFIISLPILKKPSEEFANETLEAKPNGTYLSYRG